MVLFALEPPQGLTRVQVGYGPWWVRMQECYWLICETSNIKPTKTTIPRLPPSCHRFTRVMWHLRYVS